MTIARHRLPRIVALHLRSAAALCSLALLSAPLSAQQTMGQQHPFRELSGTVTDPGHEPVRGAVVQLESENTHAIVTYITGEDGRYFFKRLSGDQNYRVWVVFRKRNSKTHELSKFDDHTDKVIDFTIEAF
jgi:hypothetical protein